MGDKEEYVEAAPERARMWEARAREAGWKADDHERVSGDVGPRCGACGYFLRRLAADQHAGGRDGALWREVFNHLLDEHDFDEYVIAAAAGGGGGGAATGRGGTEGQSGAERPGGAGAGGDAAPGAGVRGAAVPAHWAAYFRRVRANRDDDEEVKE